MQCEIIRDTQTIAGPMSFEPDRVRDIIMRLGGDYRLVPNGLINAIHMGTISVLPVRYVKPDIAVTQTFGTPERTASQEEVTYTYPVVERNPDEVLEEQREAKLQEINTAYTAAVTPLIKDYPEVEQQTWIAQEQEARAYLKWHTDPQREAPITPVLDNANMFTQAQQMTGKRQRLVKLARAAEALDALESIRWQ